MNINPWLASIVRKFRRLRDDVQLRCEYELAVRNDEDLPWEQYLTTQALGYAFRDDPYLMTLRRNMDLPYDTICALYHCHVDCLADLLQLSQEELNVCAEMYGFKTLPVTRYLREHGYKLLRSGVRTYKIRSSLMFPALRNMKYMTWTLPSPGAAMDFDPDRPHAEDWWVDEYYARYAYAQGEELLFSDWKWLKPPLYTSMPGCYYSFFESARAFSEDYKLICAAENIKDRFFLWDRLPEDGKDIVGFSNDSLLRMKRNYVMALIDILERTTLLRECTPAEFLTATDEEKLNTIEDMSGNDDFRNLLLTYVELQINFETILRDMLDYFGRPARPMTYEGRPRAVSHSTAKALLECRRRYTDEELRAKYLKCLKVSPDRSWADFLMGCALTDL